MRIQEGVVKNDYEVRKSEYGRVTSANQLGIMSEKFAIQQ